MRLFAALLGKAEELMHEKCLKRKNPWKRECLLNLGEVDADEYFSNIFLFNYSFSINQVATYYRANLSPKIPKFEVEGDNSYLDVDTKKAALKVSSSVIALLSYTGEHELTQCSGVLIENDGNDANIVLTSANLIRRPTEEKVMEDKLADRLKGLWRPSLGFMATNLYTADIYVIEKVIQKILSTCNGVLVEKVLEGSSGDSAGLHLNGVIVSVVEKQFTVSWSFWRWFGIRRLEIYCNCL